MSYLLLKALHIVSSTVLFGTGIGTAFFMWMANRSGNRAAIVVVTRTVIKADLFFTAPAVLVQPLSGLALMAMAGFPLQFAPLNWLGASLLLYALAIACWLPVLWLQGRMHRLAAAGPAEAPLPAAYWRCEKVWVLLGIPAFLSLVAVFWLMVAKPF